VELGKEFLPPGSGLIDETGKGVLTSRIRIKWWNWEREYLPSGLNDRTCLGEYSLRGVLT
jgi:hypothetical protein